MIQALRKHAVVEEDGRIVIPVPELKPGTRAEVIVLEQSGGEKGRGVLLSSLIGSCKGMFNRPEEADRFLDEERSSWER